MSDLLYSTRLRFCGRCGVAKLRGVSVPIFVAPDLGAGPVHAVDYVPEVRITEIMPRACDARRDMTPEEIEAADALLVELTRGA